MFSPAELEKKLSELIDVHGVPGAQLCVLDGDQLTEVAAGVLSQRTGCPSRPDALFLPGSIGKVYTATLVMMLVEEGKLDLDVPIRHYLPDFEVRDPHARDTVTARQLLSHTSGFDGDHFTDTGRGDDALALYVAGCSDLPQIVAPGKIWSYSNSGYAVLGRVVEVLSGLTFEEALRQRLFVPLELASTVSFADEAIVHPVAVGHVPDPEDPNRLIFSPDAKELWHRVKYDRPLGKFAADSISPGGKKNGGSSATPSPSTSASPSPNQEAQEEKRRQAAEEAGLCA